MHEAMEQIAMYWGHVAEFAISQTVGGRSGPEGAFCRVKIWKTVTDGAIRMEWKPRDLTETQMYGLAHSRASAGTGPAKLRLIQEMFDGHEKADIAKLKASIEREKKRR